MKKRRMVLFTGLVLILAAVTGWLLGPYPTIDESRVHPSLRGLVDSTKCGWASWGDGGIDGLKFFHDVDKAGVRKILVSVKGGSTVCLSMVKDLITTVTHNGAEIGLFVTLTPPTQPMIAEAAKAGFYTSASGEKFARLQILTIRTSCPARPAPSTPITNRTSISKMPDAKKTVNKPN
jgi:hypothetical protein